jgi:ferric-dicitrate binding protein FerR (iron transport regulator)
MNDNRLLELIGKKQAGEISPSELIELHKLIQGDPAHAEFLKTLEIIWDTPLLTGEEISEAHARDRWQKVREKWAGEKPVEQDGKVEALRPVGPSRRISIWKYAGAAAACGIILAGTGMWWAGRFNAAGGKAQGHSNVVTTKNGSHSRVTLPDGTEVWLNAGSNLSYDEAYGKETRELRLVGEAFFDVAKDAGHPFVIHTKVMDIKVLGTTFNVRAYPDEPATEAALIKGAIEISLPGRPSDRMLLKPDEKITVRNDEPELHAGKDSLTGKAATKQDQAAGPSIAVSKIAYEPGDSTIIETSWVKNKLIFRDKPFWELAREMERWYNVVFVVKNKDLPAKRFTGIFYNESVREALDKLKVSYPFSYTYDKKSNTITIE